MLTNTRIRLKILEYKNNSIFEMLQNGDFTPNILTSCIISLGAQHEYVTPNVYFIFLELKPRVIPKSSSSFKINQNPHLETLLK